MAQTFLPMENKGKSRASQFVRAVSDALVCGLASEGHMPREDLKL